MTSWWASVLVGLVVVLISLRLRGYITPLSPLTWWFEHKRTIDRLSVGPARRELQTLLLCLARKRPGLRLGGEARRIFSFLLVNRSPSVSAGHDYSLVLTEGGDVFSFGHGWYGRLGHGDEKHQHLPKLVEALKGKNVVQVSAGADHSLALTKGGDVFSFGYGYSGKLGHGDKKNQHLPKLVAALEGKKVVQVSAGANHSLVLAENGDVFSFGWGQNGRLGHGDEEDQHLPKLVEALKGKKVVQVSAGACYSLVLTGGGDVFSFGYGHRGQLGHGDEKHQHLPKLVEALKGKKVVQVSAGAWHSLVLTDCGDVFSFGEGTNGKLGHGDKKNQVLPKLVEALKGKKVVQVSAGQKHSLVLTEGGDIFSFGMGYQGRLGHGDEEDQHMPKLVEALKGKKIVQVSAGWSHSLVLMENGNVFSFGYGEDGQLGHGGGPEAKNQHLPKLVN